MMVPSPGEYLRSRRRGFDPAAAVCRWFRRVVPPPPDLEAVRAIQLLLEQEPIRTLPKCDRTLRDLRFLRVHGSLPSSREDAGRLEELGDAAPVLLGVATMVRDGFLREQALRRLVCYRGRLVAGFILIRLHDHVPAIVEVARAAMEARLADRPPDDLVRCLPLVHRLRALCRAHRSLAERILAHVRADADALGRGFRCREDEDVRLAALELWVESPRPAGEVEPPLRVGLADASPRIREHAARLATRRMSVPADVLERLRPFMLGNRSPAVRRAALSAAAGEVPLPLLEEAAFDGNAGVRIQARRLLYRRTGSLDYRGRAHCLLRDPDAPRARIVAALAVLSEYGQPGDREVIERFAADPRPSVAREARRALSLLD